MLSPAAGLAYILFMFLLGSLFVKFALAAMILCDVSVCLLCWGACTDFGFWAIISSMGNDFSFLNKLAAMLSLVKDLSMNMISFKSLAANCLSI